VEEAALIEEVEAAGAEEASMAHDATGHPGVSPERTAIVQSGVTAAKARTESAVSATIVLREVPVKAEVVDVVAEVLPAAAVSSKPPKWTTSMTSRRWPPLKMPARPKHCGIAVAQQVLNATS